MSINEPTDDTGHWRAGVDRRLAEGGVRMDALDRGQAEILKRQDDLAAAVAAQAEAIRQNTEITEQIRDMWKAGTWGHKAIIWIGGLAGGLAGMVGLWAALRSLFRDGAA